MGSVMSMHYCHTVSVYPLAINLDLSDWLPVCDVFCVFCYSCCGDKWIPQSRITCNNLLRFGSADRQTAWFTVASLRRVEILRRAVDMLGIFLIQQIQTVLAAGDPLPAAPHADDLRDLLRHPGIDVNYGHSYGAGSVPQPTSVMTALNNSSSVNSLR